MSKMIKVLLAQGYEKIVCPHHPKITDVGYCYAVVVVDHYPKERIDYERSLGFTTPHALDSTEYQFLYSKSLRAAEGRKDVIMNQEYSGKATQEARNRIQRARNERWRIVEVVPIIESDQPAPASVPKRKNQSWVRVSEEFSKDTIEHPHQHAVNALISKKAADLAENLTEMDCKIRGIKCWIGKSVLTTQAQKIHDAYYDKFTSDLYELLNEQIKEISKSHK